MLNGIANFSSIYWNLIWWKKAKKLDKYIIKMNNRL